MSIKEELLEILDEYEITVQEDGHMDEVDSLSFVSLIIKLEEKYKIAFPDEILILESVKDINNLSIIIEQLIGNQNENN